MLAVQSQDTLQPAPCVSTRMTQMQTSFESHETLSNATKPPFNMIMASHLLSRQSLGSKRVAAYALQTRITHKCVPPSICCESKSSGRSPSGRNLRICEGMMRKRMFHGRLRTNSCLITGLYRNRALTYTSYCSLSSVGWCRDTIGRYT